MLAQQHAAQFFVIFINIFFIFYLKRTQLTLSAASYSHQPMTLDPAFDCFFMFVCLSVSLCLSIMLNVIIYLNLSVNLMRSQLSHESC